MLGWDVPRLWATNVQVFKNPDHCLFVFRELVQIEAEEGGEKSQIVRNVGSVVMPLDVAASFADVMSKLMTVEENAA